MGSVNRITRSVEDQTLPHARCRYCELDIVEAPEVGWLDPAPGGTYDLCPDAPYGNHEPRDARGDTRGRYGPLS